jgi:Translation initiation factor 2B subunit, eIF-2B alpha/beta/delta family
MEIIEQRIQKVISDREHGSRWLAREALLILRDIATSQSDNQQTSPADSVQEAAPVRQLITSAEQIAEARPAMAALANAMGQVVSAHSEGLAAMGAVAQQLLDTYETATQQMAEYAQPLISGQIMTCSISGTILAVFQALKDQIEHVFVLEGRPRYEGRNTAQALSEMGIATTLITDAQADIFLPVCQSVVVGADSLLINGDVLNKAGTALLAWAAHGHGIPFYVLCETLKISARRWYEHDTQRRASNLQLLEEKEPQEVFATPPAGVRVRNYYFDHTPYRLVTNIITELGLLERREIRDRAVTTRAQLRLLSNLAKK